MRTLLLLSVFEPQDIGARIAAARKEAGLTQEELADLVSVSTRSLQGYESGEVVPYRHLGKIAEVTRRTVAWFLHGDIDSDVSVDERLAHIEGQLDEIRGLLDRPAGGGAASKPPAASPRRSPSR